MKLLKTLRYGFRGDNWKQRKTKVWKPKHYEAIPYFMKPHFIDIHDTYKLRSIDEVKAELKGKIIEIER